MMREIQLSEHGKKYKGAFVALVDDCDFDAISTHRWRVCVQGSEQNRRIYAVRRIAIDGKPADLRMHRVVWELANGPIPAGFEIDHINHGELGGLDNRRSNLRLTTKSLNQANSRKGRNNTSGFKGVWWQRQACKWRVDILVNRKKIHIGYFDDKREAALAYDAAARTHFGEFALVNIPTGAA